MLRACLSTLKRLKPSKSFANGPTRLPSHTVSMAYATSSSFRQKFSDETGNNLPGHETSASMDPTVGSSMDHHLSLDHPEAFYDRLRNEMDMEIKRRGYGWQDGKFVEIPLEEFSELSMKQLMETEPCHRSILFGRVAMLNDNLRTLFELKGISDKFKRKRITTLETDEAEEPYEEGRITNTTLHSAMEEIEKNHDTFFGCYHPTMSSREMGEAALELIKDARIIYDILINYDDNTLGVEKMYESLNTFLYLVEIETEYLRNISSPCTGGCH